MIDVCPTGLTALERSDMRHLPLAVWMAAQRHFEHARRHPNMANIFEQALADIEVMGLLKQAEAALGTSPFSAPVPSPDVCQEGGLYIRPELRSPVPEPANNKQANNKAMTVIHIIRTEAKPSNAAAPATPQTPANGDTISKLDKELTAAAQASRRSTPALNGAQARPQAPVRDKVKEILVQICRMWAGHEGVNYETTTSENLALLIKDAVLYDHATFGSAAQPKSDQNARLLHLSAECLRLSGLLHAAEQKINRARMSATIAMGSFNALGALFRKKEAEIQQLNAEVAETKASNATLLKALHRAETAAAAHAASR